MSQPTPQRGPGRPRTKDSYDPPRAAGRHGPIWEECVAQAEADGERMTDFVGKAIRRELAWRREQASRQSH